ncbi:hypothetical protein PHLCEN_2v5509 [Hermanssonia centrifuga]|uniref:Uncharacterized protein n=1 Tax=Hermanssonia centrifuga TaxID=98765 RepID=A0A2R6P2C5_9APHY|nr:hypothetical protein PHLCEN_2v5509 [Hermanssonia centrifuga]
MSRGIRGPSESFLGDVRRGELTSTDIYAIKFGTKSSPRTGAPAASFCRPEHPRIA